MTLSCGGGYFATAGWSSDLIVFGPGHEHRFSFFDYALRLSNQTSNLVHCIRTIGESLEASSRSRGGDQELFWVQRQDYLTYSASEILKQATGTVTAPLLMEFISTAALAPEQLLTESFRKGLHSQLLEKAFQKEKSAIEQHDFDLAAAYWCSYYPTLADRTRSSIVAGVTGILHVFNSGIARSLISEGTTVSPDDMFQGKWVLVDMATAKWGPAGALVAGGWKYLTQRSVLQRATQPGDAINVIWCDEAAGRVTSFDSTYLAECRSHLGCMVYLTQSLPSFYTAFKGEAAEHLTHSLVANFGHTIVHAIDPKTAEWASQKLGRRLQTFYGGSSGPSGDMAEELFGTSRFTGSFSESYELVLQENAFLNGLRTGGPLNKGICDGYVLKSGEPFSTGENFLRVPFQQG